MDTDGIDLTGALDGRPLPSRTIYSESFAPLFDFAWSPLRTVREGTWKYVAAPHPELYDIQNDPGETRNAIQSERGRASELARKTDAVSPATLTSNRESMDSEARRRLLALGYASGRPSNDASRPDPKDRRELAARVAQVASGELQGAQLESALRAILREDPDNPQANQRFGYVLAESGRCTEAMTYFANAIAHNIPTADAYLGMAGCQIAAKNPSAAERTLREAARVEPGNPVVTANLGIVLSDGGHSAEGVKYLQQALSLDPDLHQARFSLAIAYGRLGRRSDAAREATELLRRLPPTAPQRSEVERLLATVR
jgi:choline-sulfatase